MIGLHSNIGFAAVKLAQQIAKPSKNIIKLDCISVNTCLILASIG